MEALVLALSLWGRPTIDGNWQMQGLPIPMKMRAEVIRGKYLGQRDGCICPCCGEHCYRTLGGHKYGPHFHQCRYGTTWKHEFLTK